ncbi:hypothetical protein J2T21_000077 [Paeniglutamicibacter psychrophenolicus]|nr:hypothetical protein [Paeniglutamicibacter psychrophenolicus]
MVMSPIIEAGEAPSTSTAACAGGREKLWVGAS